MRQHVRQELREHLLDALAQHQAAGLSADEALDRALEEFGKPDEVRSDLEAAHGRQRMMALVIDRALQWKERTMRAKWLWMSWAYLGLTAVIALEVLFITFSVVFIVPKFKKLLRDGLIDPAIINEQGMSWMPAFLDDLSNVAGGYATWWLLLAAAAWGLFEWRVRSENKPWMRLSALGTAAVGLMVVVVLTAAALVISFCLGVPQTARLARPYAVQQVVGIDTALGALKEAQTKKDWQASEEHVQQAMRAVVNLNNTASVVPSLSPGNEPPTVGELRACLSQALEDLGEAHQAIQGKDAGRLEAALQKFHKSFAPVREAAKRPVH
jgi:hypothetical protein